jgi:hypothetical protein
MFDDIRNIANDVANKAEEAKVSAMQVLDKDGNGKIDVIEDIDAEIDEMKEKVKTMFNKKIDQLIQNFDITHFDEGPPEQGWKYNTVLCDRETPKIFPTG